MTRRSRAQGVNLTSVVVLRPDPRLCGRSDYSKSIAGPELFADLLFSDRIDGGLQDGQKSDAGQFCGLYLCGKLVQEYAVLSLHKSSSL